MKIPDKYRFDPKNLLLVDDIMNKSIPEFILPHIQAFTLEQLESMVRSKTSSENDFREVLKIFNVFNLLEYAGNRSSSPSVGKSILARRILLEHGSIGKYIEYLNEEWREQEILKSESKQNLQLNQKILKWTAYAAIVTTLSLIASMIIYYASK
jgi:hypothetical protein